MFTTVFTAVTAFKQILFREDDVAFLGIVKVLWLEVRATEIIIHITHVCKVNKNRC